MKRKIPLLAILCLIFFACNKHVTEPQSQQTGIPSEILQTIKKMGFKTDDVLKIDSGYIVEKDLFISNSKIENFDPSQTVHTEQVRTENIVMYLPRTITISLSGLTGSYYTNAVDIAIARYNSLNINLTFSRVASGGAIQISGFSDLSNVNAVTPNFPSNGDPGNLIYLNTYRFSLVNDVNWAASVIQHELGHCIGFRHTDYTDRSYSCGGPTNDEGYITGVGALPIIGVPVTPNAESWMLACIPDNYNRTFNTFDLTALNSLYGNRVAPYNPSASPVYEYWSNPYKDHYYVFDYSPTIGSGNWYFSWMAFYAFHTQVTGSVPVYEYWSSQYGDHYYTTTYGGTTIEGSWNYESIYFYAFNTQVTGSVPVYQYWSAQNGDHYYTTIYAGPTTGDGAWQYEKIAFYAYPSY